MKTQEELTQLKTEYETLNNKLKELTEDELGYVTGGLTDEGYIDWKSSEELPTESGKYKLK